MAEATIAEKHCSLCGGTKSASAFYVDTRTTTGLSSRCKECSRNATKQRYRDNPEQIKIQQQVYYRAHRTEEIERAARWVERNRDRRREIVRVYKERHQEPERARNREFQRHKFAAMSEDERRAVWREDHKRFRTKRPDRNAEIKKQSKQKMFAEDPERFRAQAVRNQHARRARLQGNGGTFTDAEWASLKERYDFTCLACKRREPDIKLTADHIRPVSRGGSNDIENIQPLCLECNLKKFTKAIDYRPS